MSSPLVGDPAPDAVVLDGAGDRANLSTLWRDRPALLVFLRHYG
jgi:hypothetical protein